MRTLVSAIICAGCLTIIGCFSQTARVESPKFPAFQGSEAWRAFGSYSLRVVQLFDRRIESALTARSYFPNPGTTVTFLISVEADGSFRVAEDAAAKSSVYEFCRDAVKKGGPLPPWTLEMIDKLGRTQEISYTYRIQ